MTACGSPIRTARPSWPNAPDSPGSRAPSCGRSRVAGAGLGERLILGAEGVLRGQRAGDVRRARRSDLGSDVHYDQAPDAFGVGGREHEGDDPAHGQAHQGHFAQIQSVEEAQEILCHRSEAVFRCPVGVAVAALVQSDHAVAAAEQGRRIVPGAGVAGQPVQHHQRRTVAAPVCVVEPQPADLDVARSEDRWSHSLPPAQTRMTQANRGRRGAARRRPPRISRPPGGAAG